MTIQAFLFRLEVVFRVWMVDLSTCSTTLDSNVDDFCTKSVLQNGSDEFVFVCKPNFCCLFLCQLLESAVLVHRCV